MASMGLRGEKSDDQSAVTGNEDAGVGRLENGAEKGKNVARGRVLLDGSAASTRETKKKRTHLEPLLAPLSSCSSESLALCTWPRFDLARRLAEWCECYRERIDAREKRAGAREVLCREVDDSSRRLESSTTNPVAFGLPLARSTTLAHR